MEALRYFWLQLRSMVRKELLATLKDKRMRLTFLLPPLLQAILFGYAANNNLDNVPYAVYDMSHSELSRDILSRVEGSSAFSRVSTVSSMAEISQQIDADEILLALVVPEDFERRLSQGEEASLQVIANGQNSSVASMGIGYISQIVSAWNAERAGSPLTIDSRTWYNPNQTTRWTMLPSLLVMISFIQVLLLGGLSIAREREQGTFDQLLVTPLPSSVILIGKAIPPVIIGLFQSLVVFSIVRFWFGVPFAGSYLTLLLTVLIFMVSSTGLGLSISAISDNMQQVLVYVFFLSMPLVLLSGLATPVDNMPRALQLLTYMDPVRFAIAAVRRIYLEGATFSQIAPNFLPMLGVAAVTMPLSAWLFRNRTS